MLISKRCALIRVPGLVRTDQSKWNEIHAAKNGRNKVYLQNKEQTYLWR